MALTPDDIEACARQAADARRSVARLLRREPLTATLDDRRWGAAITAADRAAADLLWTRDALTLLARRVGITWPALEATTGIADATLSSRARRLAEREDT